jgi:hypothetical protein
LLRLRGRLLRKDDVKVGSCGGSDRLKASAAE